MRTELDSISRRVRALASRATSPKDRALIEGITKAVREAHAKFDLMVLSMPEQFHIIGAGNLKATAKRAGRKAKPARRRRLASPPPEAFAVPSSEAMAAQA